MNSFKNKVAVVTGAGGGMGLQISLDLLHLGAKVILMDLKQEPEVLKQYSGDYIYKKGDLTTENFVHETITSGVHHFGRIDYLINAAGILLFDNDKSVVDIEFDVWDKVFDVNIKACARTAKHCVPEMIANGGGAMVHISTIQCYRGDATPQDAYQASKAGVIALSKSLAIQFADKGIRSNVIAPGMIETPLQVRWETDTALKEKTAAQVPLQRLGSAKDIANACLFLLSEDAGYITGTELIVDGGLLARP